MPSRVDLRAQHESARRFTIVAESALIPEPILVVVGFAFVGPIVLAIALFGLNVIVLIAISGLQGQIDAIEQAVLGVRDVPDRSNATPTLSPQETLK